MRRAFDQLLAWGLQHPLRAVAIAAAALMLELYISPAVEEGYIQPFNSWMLDGIGDFVDVEWPMSVTKVISFVQRVCLTIGAVALLAWGLNHQPRRSS